MSYENAPGTELIATSCACCARPLLDAVSVETGVGPDCRRKFGFNEAQQPADMQGAFALLASLATTETAETFLAPFRCGEASPRELSNLLVHRIAAAQIGEHVNAYTNAIRALGFVKLADRIAERIAKVVIEADANELTVKVPYSEEAVHAFRKVPGRRWDREAKVYRLPATSKRALFNVLRDLFPGVTARGPKGVFVLAI
jgi:hypothetical protein